MDANLQKSPLSRLLEPLTAAEEKILFLMARGLSDKEISLELNIAPITIRGDHKQNIYDKLGLEKPYRSKKWALHCARNLGLIQNETDDTVQPLDIDNPYKGLDAFQREDAHLFFGREEFIEELLDRVQAMDKTRFLALVGASGSGKSSVIRAGLIPALIQNRGSGSSQWRMVTMFPRVNPFYELETALQRVAAKKHDNILDLLRRDAYGLVRVSSLIFPKDQPLLLVIDQFEELFTLVDQEQLAFDFMDTLYAAATDPQSQIRIVITLRADFLDRPLSYPDMAWLLKQNSIMMIPMTPDEVERAITLPARQMRVEYDAGVVAKLVTETSEQPGALPLLEFALTELYDNRMGNKITAQTFEAVGGLHKALAAQAEKIYATLTKRQQQVAHQIFLRLITLGEGTEDLRRRVLLRELTTLEGMNDLMEPTVHFLAANRLLTLDLDYQSGESTVEVAHEALIREWERLHKWLDESRVAVRLERLLGSQVTEWENHHRDVSFLLRGARLAQFADFRAHSGIKLTEIQNTFLDASFAEHKRQEQLEREQQEQRRRLETRARTVLRALVAVFAIAAIVGSALALTANNERIRAEGKEQEAIEALDIAQRSGLALAAGDAMDVNEVDLAVALALESVGDDEAHMLPETLRILERIENQAGPQIWRTNDGFDCSPRISRDYRYFVWSDCKSRISVWDTLMAEKLGDMNMPELFDFSHISFAGFSRDGTRLLIAQPDTFPGIFDIAILDMERWEIVATYTLEEPVSRIYFTADSSMIATMEIAPENLTLAQESGKHIGDSISLRNAETGEIIRQYRFDNQWIQNFDLSWDGKLGVVNGWSGWDGPDVDNYRAIIFDMETGDILHIFDRPHNENLSETSWNSAWAGFNIDGTKLFVSGFPNYLIDIATGEDYSTIRQLEGGPISYPDPNFQYVMNQDVNFNPQLFHIETGEIQKFDVNFAYLAAESGTILTADLGRMDEFQIWDIAGRNSNTSNIRQKSLASGVKYSPDGRQVVVTNSGWGCADVGNQNNAIYNAETLEVIGHLDGDRNMSFGIDWSPDGQYIVTGTFKEAILWDATNGAEIRRFTGTQDCIMRLKFSPDGRYLYGAHGSWFTNISYEVPPYLVQWNVETGEEIQRFEFPVEETPNWGVIGLALHPTRNIATVAITTRFMEGCEQGSCDFESYILNLDTGEITSIAEPMISIGFALEGQVILGNALPNSIYVVDADSGQILSQWSTLDSQNFGTAISPDGQYLLTGAGPLAFESGISLWDIETGELIRRYFSNGQQTFIINMDFHPDGTHFVSSAFEPVIRFWDVDTQSTLGWVRENRVVRDFTCVEREQYRIEPLCDD